MPAKPKHNLGSVKEPMKYSEIRKLIPLKEARNHSEGLAALTHFWQTNGDVDHKYYRGKANSFLNNFSDPILREVNDIDYDVPFPPLSKFDFTFIDLFAGIGGCRLAFQSQKGKCVFSSEWDRWSKLTYEANFGEVPFGDITQIDEKYIPDHDILVGGFPCQPFSLAGVSKKNSLGRAHGFEDETQGTLFFDIKRILKEKKPKAFLLENVKNLKSHDGGNTFRVIIDTLEGLNYHVFTQVIDARHYVPQHRERVFLVGFHKDHFGKEKLKYQFPKTPSAEFRLRDILEKKPAKKYTLTDNLWKYLQGYAAKHKALGNGFGFNLTNLDGVARTLSARYHKDGAEILIPQKAGENPRRLTPEECRRLMGYPETFKIKDIEVSDTQLYRQFGNSVAVPVVEDVAKSMVEFIQNHTLLNIKLPTVQYTNEHR